MYAYPSFGDFSQSGMALVAHFRKTEVLPTPALVQHAWTVLGYIAKVGLGEGAAPPLFGPIHTSQELQWADMIEAGIAPALGGDEKAIPAWLIPVLLQIVKWIIDGYLRGEK